MRSKLRDIRDAETTRRAILDAARSLFVREGYEKVSMRKIAERIEISPAAIYLHFRNKADVLSALAEDGFRRFARVLADPADGAPDPLAALERYFWRYYEFSRRQPGYFRLMFVRGSSRPLGRDPEAAAWMRQAWAETDALVARCVAAGRLPAATDARAAFHLLFAVVHGAAVIRLEGRYCSHRDADLLAEDMLRAALAGLAAGAPLRYGASHARPPRDATPDAPPPVLSAARARDRAGRDEFTHGRIQPGE